MAFSQSDIEALEGAIKTGVLRVKYADREVTYQSTDAMLKVLAQMRREVAAAAGTKSYSYISTNKGL